MQKNNIIWLDISKIFACIFVVVGHFAMSMAGGQWIDRDTSTYQIFIQMIYPLIR